MTTVKMQMFFTERVSPVDNGDGTWTTTIWPRDAAAYFTVNDIKIGDKLIYETTGLEVTPSLASFTIVDILGIQNNRFLQCIIRYDDENDNIVPINDFSLISTRGTVTRPTEFLDLMPTISPDRFSFEDYWAENLSGINLERLDKKLGDILGLDSNGDYVPQGSSSNTSISDDIQELFGQISEPVDLSPVESSLQSLRDELDDTQTAIGLDTDGSYVPQGSSSSTSIATDIGELFSNFQDVVDSVDLIKDAGDSLDSFRELQQLIENIDSAQDELFQGKFDDIQNELDATQTAIGLDTDGSYDPQGSSASTSIATDIGELFDGINNLDTSFDESISLQGSHLIHVDQYKSGTYTPDGSINKPYKTIEAAYNSTVPVSGVSTILIGPGDYVEDLTISNNSQKTINFIGLGGDQSNTVAILGNVKIDGPQTKVQMKDIRIESPDGTRPALLVNGCRNSSFQNMTIRYGNTVVPTENVLKVTSSGTGDGIVDFLSCSIHPQTPDSEHPDKGGILVDGPNERQVRFYRCNYGANITMPSTNKDIVYLYQCAAFGKITHDSGILVVDQSQITGVDSKPNIDYSSPTKNFLQVTNSSLRDASNGGLRGDINKTGTSLYLIGNNDSNPDNPPYGGTSLGDFIGFKHLSYSRHAAEDYYANPEWAGVENVKEALDKLESSIGLSSVDGSYVPKGSTANTNISDDIEELFLSISEGVGNASVTVSETPPSENPEEGDLWYDTENLTLKIYYSGADTAGDDAWIEASPGNGYIATNYSDVQVDALLNRDSAGDGQVLSWNGIDYEWVDADYHFKFDSAGDGQVLSWNDQTNEYVWIDRGLYSSEVDSHLNSDSAGDGQVLSWNDQTNEYVWIDRGLYSSEVDSHLNSGTASEGQLLSWNGTDYEWITNTTTIISDTEPTNAKYGDLWWDSDEGSLKIYYANSPDTAGDDIWVDASPSSSSSTTSSGANVTVSDTSPSSPSNGDLWFDSINGVLKVYYVEPNLDSAPDSYWISVSSSGSSSSTTPTPDNITDGTSTLSFDSNNNVSIDTSIIPSQNAQFDLGSAEYKIRHLFLSDNSIYMGSQTDSAGEMVQFTKENVERSVEISAENIAPQNQDAPGNKGDMRIVELPNLGGGYLYVHNGIKWVRSPLEETWSI